MYMHKGFMAFGKRNVILLFVTLFVLFGAERGSAQNVNATWGSNGNSAWYTASNWAGGAYPGQQGAAASNGNTATFTNSFTGTTVGINMNTNSLNLGAVHVTNVRTTALNIGNSSTTVSGVLRLYGANVNSVPNTILRNAGTGLLTMQAAQQQAMGIVLSNPTENIINCDGTGGISITSILSGGASGITKTGADDLTLVTNNTYTGKTRINAGAIIGSGESMFGANPGAFTADQIIFNGGTLQASGAINFSSNRGITVSTGGATFNNTNANLITLTNVMTGSGPITKTGNGTLLLAGAHTFTGLVTVTTGTVQLAAAGTYPDASALSLAGGTVFDMKGFSETIGSLASTGTGTVTSTASGAITLTAGGNNSSTTFSGVIQNGSATLLGLTKAGTGALTLSGTNTYTGATNVSAGTLFINSSTAAGSAVTVGVSGTLAGNGTASGTTALTGTVSPGATAGTTGKLTTGAFTFNTGCNYTFNINNVSGTQGTTNGWDLLTSTGALNINASAASPIQIDLTSVGSTGFNTCTSYTWTLAQGTSITGFAANEFSVNTSGFVPSFTGAFSIVATSTAINLVYTAPLNTITLTSGAGTNNQSKCINTALTTITYTTTNATGANITGLPTGVSGNWAANTVTISGTPSVAGTFTYSVALTGGCGTISATGTITVKSVTIDAISDQTVCGGKIVNATSFSSTPAGASFAWINNNTFIGLTGAGSGNVPSFVSPVVSSTQTGTITVIATLNGCNAPSATYSITINGSLPASTWTGSVSTDWFDPDNWTNCVCGASTDATIDAVTNNPILNATGDVLNLTMNSGSSITLQGANTLNIYGNVVNDGTIDAQAGSTIFLGGVTAQSISGASSNSFYNLTLDNSFGASLSTALGINGTLSLTNGTLSTNDNLTLVANQSGPSFTTGNIGPISATADITGNVTIEQYAVRSGSTNWGFLGAPVGNASGLTMSDWNDNFSITCTNCPDGAAPGGSTFTSIYSYDETGTGLYDDVSKYVGIEEISDPIELTKGYWVYLGNGLGTAIKFNVTGSVAKANTAQLDIPLTYTDHGSLPDDGWNLISNPLPCPISWTSLLGSTTDIDDAIYVYNSATGSYAQYVAGVSSPALGAGGIGDEIPMCQGFYVHSSGATVLTATENTKVAAANPDFLRINPNHPTVQNYIPVPRLFLSNSTGYRDETAFHFNTNASISFDVKYDTYKLIGDYTLPYLAGISSDGKMCSINGLPGQTTSLPIKAITPVSGPFTFALGGDTINGTCVNLYDSYTGITTNLTVSSYTCTLHDTTTMARFTLSFSSAGLAATTSITQPVCSDLLGLITAIGNNAGPWNYVWKDDNGVVVKTSLNKTSADSLSQLNSGNYTVEINTAGQCDNYSETFSVTAIEIPSAQFTSSADTVDLALSGFVYFEPLTSGNSTYSWNFGDGAGVSSLANPTYNYSAVGNYSVVLTAISAANCTDTSYASIVVVNTSVGLQSLNASGTIVLANTSPSVCTLLFSEPTTREIGYSLFDMNGKEVCQLKSVGIEGGKLDIDISTIAAGIYLLIVEPKGQEPAGFKLNKY
jgi:autotransporter-associated beta strand protein